MCSKSLIIRTTPLVAAVLAAASGAMAQTIRSGAGAAGANIQSALDTFRADLGTLNANVPLSQPGGRREVNWDGVPDASSSPNLFPPDFFNGTTTGRARGVLFTAPSGQFQVSANAASGVPLAFGNIDPHYSSEFAAFSPQRLFTAVGSNTYDVVFFVPGSSTPATTRGFGAVFSDVDVAGSSSIEYFDVNNNSLGVFSVPSAGNGRQTFSFLGVSFSDSVVARVRVTAGNFALGPGVFESPGFGGPPTDLVVVDDFIFGEQTAVPGPGGATALIGAGALALRRRRR